MCPGELRSPPAYGTVQCREAQSTGGRGALRQRWQPEPPRVIPQSRGARTRAAGSKQVSLKTHKVSILKYIKVYLYLPPFRGQPAALTTPWHIASFPDLSHARTLTVKRATTAQGGWEWKSSSSSSSSVVVRKK